MIRFASFFWIYFIPVTQLHNKINFVLKFVVDSRTMYYNASLKALNHLFLDSNDLAVKV